MSDSKKEDNSNSSGGEACNIDLKGRKQRTRFAKIVLSLALSFAGYLAYREKNDKLEGAVRYASWALAQGLFVSAAIIYQQVLDGTCVAHGLMGTEEEGPDTLKAVKVTDQAKADKLRQQSVGVVCKGTAKGAALAALLVLGPVWALRD